MTDTTTAPDIQANQRPTARMLAIGPAPTSPLYGVPLADLDDKIGIALGLAGVAEIDATWTALSAKIGKPGKTTGVVLNDTGTHTDPILGGTVSNSGFFRYWVGGWSRIGSLDSVNAAASVAASAVSAGNAAADAADARAAAAAAAVSESSAAGSASVAQAAATAAALDSPPLTSVSIVPPALSGGIGSAVMMSAPANAGTQTSGSVYGNINMAVSSEIIRSTGIFYDTSANRIYDSVLNIAQNTNGSITSKANAAMPIQRMAMESAYAQSAGGMLICEFHPVSVIGQSNAPSASHETRCVSWVVPLDYNNNPTGIEGYLRANLINFASGTGDQCIMLTMNASQRTMDFFPTGGDAMQIRLGQNDRAPLALLNAASSAYLEPMRLLSSNRLAMSIPRNEQITAIGGGPFGVGMSGIETGFTFAASGGVGHYRIVVGGTNQTMAWDDTGITGTLQYLRRNVGGGRVVDTISAPTAAISFENPATSQGPQVRFNTTADQLEIQADGYRGDAATTGGINIKRTSGQATFVAPPRVPPFTVGTLPSVAIYGDGSIAEVSDLGLVSSGAIAVGGGTIKALVMSDGTNWRVVQPLIDGVDVQIFTGNGTWTKPGGAQSVYVWACGAGGGGGSGRKGAAASVRCGGGGGVGGSVSFSEFPAAILPSTVSVTVAAGGAGGTAQATNSSDGSSGGTPTAHTAFGSFIWAPRGNPGAGGTATTGATGAAQTVVPYAGGVGGAASVTGGVGTTGIRTNVGAAGGGSGGGITSANSASAGGTGGSDPGLNIAPTTGGAGGAVGAAGGSPTSRGNVPIAGAGGGGGGGSTSGNGGAGGAGQFPGGGGGGGGAATDSVGNSGAGGAGAGGLVIVISRG